MFDHRIEKLPLVDAQGKIAGLVTRKDLMTFRQRPYSSRDDKGRLLVGAAIGARGDFLERSAELLKAGADVLVMPTMGIAAPKIEPDPIIDSKERSHRNRAGLTTSFSLASAPTLSMCCGFTSENLPIGLQIGGKPFAEQTVLNVAYAYQQATDWHGRRPPI